MCEDVAVPRTEDETPSELEGILPEPMLLVPGGPGSGTRLGVVAPQHMEQIRRFQFGGPIGDALFIDKEREIDARFFAK